jgi:hypothetical protein
LDGKLVRTGPCPRNEGNRVIFEDASCLIAVPLASGSSKHSAGPHSSRLSSSVNPCVQWKNEIVRSNMRINTHWSFRSSPETLAVSNNTGYSPPFMHLFSVVPGSIFMFIKCFLRFPCLFPNLRWIHMHSRIFTTSSKHQIEEKNPLEKMIIESLDSSISF